MVPTRVVLLILTLLSLAGCGLAPPATPAASLPTASPVATATARPSPTPLPGSTVTAVPPSPTPSPIPPTPTPTLVPPSGEGLLAWTVAADGAVFVLDSTASLVRLSPGDLAPLARSAPLLDAAQAPAYLAAGEGQLFAGSDAISQTLVLDREDLSLVGRLEGFGPLAVEPGGRLFMIPQYLEELWPFGNFEIWAFDLTDLDKPPVTVRYTGASFDDLVIDAASRRLYMLQSNVAASPPHEGQNYSVYDLDTLAEIAQFPWERGALTRPAIHPRTGEVAGSRIGLNWTRRFLFFDREGQEVRSFASIDGQPAIDPTGEWIYLLRRQGLWLLREEDLSVQAFLPFSGPPPRDLALSPDGQTLYLFGNGWLDPVSTAELRSRGLAPFGPLPTAWFSAGQGQEYVQARVYPSPQMGRDGVAFVQMVSGVANVLETYRTTDGGRSWTLLPSLLSPDLVGAPYLSLSPDFGRDGTLTVVRDTRILRSTDGGRSWQPWQPRIAFSSDRDGDREIYTADLAGQDVQRIAGSPAAEENPAWSPAWTRLAFQSDRNGNWDIYSLRADCDVTGPDQDADCDLQQLTTDPADDLLPAWSPDGRSIAFVSTRDGNPEIYVMDTDGGNQRRLTFNPGGDWRPAWRTDSSHLLFVSDRAGNNDIYQVAVPPFAEPAPGAEAELVPIVVGPADDRDPAVRTEYVPRFLFLSDRDGLMRTYTYDFYSSPQPGTEPGGPEAHPATLTGEPFFILVTSEREGTTDIYRAAPWEYVPLIASPGFDGQPAAEAVGWRPDFDAGLAWLVAHQ